MGVTGRQPSILSLVFQLYFLAKLLKEEVKKWLAQIYKTAQFAENS